MKNTLATLAVAGLMTATLPSLAQAIPAPAAALPAPAARSGVVTPPVASGLMPAPAPSNEQLLEQRRQQELVENAERIDRANRELLAQNQQLQVQNENLDVQVKVLQGDRSAEGIRNGALAVLAGIAVGWLIFRGGGRNKGGW